MELSPGSGVRSEAGKVTAERRRERPPVVQESGLDVSAGVTATIMRAAAGGPPSPNDLPALQRLAGNRAVSGLVTQPAQVVQRVVIEDVEDEPPINNDPPREIEQPDVPLRLTDRPWSEIEHERKELSQEQDPRYQERLTGISRPKTDPKPLGAVPTAVSDRVAEQIRARDEHDEVLKGETGPIHGRARHGWQTGWEGQKRRAENKMTPEQPTDPMGTGMTIPKWKTSKEGKYKGKTRIQAPTPTKGIDEGTPVLEEHYERQRGLEQQEVELFNKQQLGQTTKSKKPAKQKTVKGASKAAKSGGPYAGSFFSAEHQNRLVATALQRVAVFDKWAEGRFAKAGWKPINFVDVVLREEPGGYGVAFSRGKGSVTPFVQKIENSPLAGGDDTMDVYLMLCAKVQLKRLKGSWQVLSSFPENLEPGISPIFDHGKDAWTGDVRDTGQTVTETLKAPTWAPEAEDT